MKRSPARSSRRAFLKAALGAPAFCRGLIVASGQTGVTVGKVALDFEEYMYRTPYRFGGREVDRATILNVRCTVSSASGKSATGFGSIPLGNIWSFPSKTLSYDATLGAMKSLARRIAGIVSDYDGKGHPIELNATMEPRFLAAASTVGAELRLSEPIPKLCTLVTASPFDAALHDGYGKLHRLSCYRTYGQDMLGPDLGVLLGRDFAGERLDRYIRKDPVPRVAMFHSIGAGDPITGQDVQRLLNDGLPQTLPDWIAFNDLRRFKIKLDGRNLDGDLARVIRIDRVVTETLQRRRVSEWFYCLDFNENCPNVEFLLEFLRRLKEATPGGFDKVLYIEQPTERDLKAHRSNTMHKAAKLRPIVIDESLTDLESLLLARELGYTGVALKACKGQSQAMLMAAAGQKYGMFLCVQDLTCPGAALVQSAGIAAHVPGTSGIEANARQYIPQASRGWEKRYPGIFSVRDGFLHTDSLTGPGLT